MCISENRHISIAYSKHSIRAISLLQESIYLENIIVHERFNGTKTTGGSHSRREGNKKDSGHRVFWARRVAQLRGPRSQGPLHPAPFSWHLMTLDDIVRVILYAIAMQNLDDCLQRDVSKPEQALYKPSYDDQQRYRCCSWRRQR